MQVDHLYKSNSDPAEKVEVYLIVDRGLLAEDSTSHNEACDEAIKGTRTNYLTKKQATKFVQEDESA